METAGHFETRYLNRMTAMLQSAFDQACAEGDILTAEELLGALETVLTRAATRDEHRERSMSVLQAAFGAMWRTKRGLQAAASSPVAARHGDSAIEAYDMRHIVQTEASQAF